MTDAPLLTYAETRALCRWVRGMVESNERVFRFGWQETPTHWKYAILGVPGTIQGQVWRAKDENDLNHLLTFIDPIAVFTLEY